MRLEGIWGNCLCHREDQNGTPYCRILTMFWGVWPEDGLTFCAETVTSGGSAVCRAGIWTTATHRWGAYEAPSLPVRRNCLRNSIVVKYFAAGFEVKCCWKIQVFCFVTPCWLVNICMCQRLLYWDYRRVRALWKIGDCLPFDTPRHISQSKHIAALKVLPTVYIYLHFQQSLLLIHHIGCSFIKRRST
jgi:hypothetical protein